MTFDHEEYRKNQRIKWLADRPDNVSEKVWADMYDYSVDMGMRLRDKREQVSFEEFKAGRDE